MKCCAQELIFSALFGGGLILEEGSAVQCIVNLVILQIAKFTYTALNAMHSKSIDFTDC